VPVILVILAEGFGNAGDGSGVDEIGDVDGVGVYEGSGCGAGVNVGNSVGWSDIWQPTMLTNSEKITNKSSARYLIILSSIAF